jgi:hypothetical protein
MPPTTKQALPRSIFEIRPGLQLILGLTGYEERIRTTSWATSAGAISSCACPARRPTG